MTIALGQAAQIPYIGNDTASAFSVAFPTFENETIEAIITDSTTGEEIETLTYSTHYTLSSVGIPGTYASLTLVNTADEWINAGKLKTGYTLTIQFKASGLQPTRLRDLGRLSPEKVEQSLDRMAMSINSMKDQLANAITMQLGEGQSGKLPSFTGNGGKMLQLSDDETGLEFGVDVAYIEDLRDDAQTAATQAEGFKDDAETAATAADASADAAALSATAASTSATNANSAKVDAQTAALNAAASEAASALSAAASDASKDVAVTKAAEAAASATAASGAAAAQTAAEAARDAAETHKDAAELAATNANTAKVAAQLAELNAETAEANAETAEANAEAARDLALQYRDEGEQFRDDAELFSSLQLYTKKIEITVADSPYQIDDDLHEHALVIVDDSGGDVVINMCQIVDTDDQEAWKVGFMKKAATGNKFTVNRAGTNTIAGATSVDVEDPGLGLLVYASSPSNWHAKYFLSVIASDGFVLSGGILYYGDPSVDGTWRQGQIAGEFKTQQRQGGVWVDATVLAAP